MGNTAQAEQLLPVSHAIKSIMDAERRTFDSHLETTSHERIGTLGLGLAIYLITNVLKSIQVGILQNHSQKSLTIRQVDLKTRRQRSDAFNDTNNHEEKTLHASTCQNSITHPTLAFAFG